MLGAGSVQRRLLVDRPGGPHSVADGYRPPENVVALLGT
jgi:hypothetical protein